MRKNELTMFELIKNLPICEMVLMSDSQLDMLENSFVEEEKRFH